MNRLFHLTFFLIVCVVVNFALDPVPPIPEGCQYGVAYSCYNDDDDVEKAGCTSWCLAVKNKLKTDFNYGSGCRYGNAQRSHGNCREGRTKMKCRKCSQKEMKTCCGTCKQDCNKDVVYSEDD